MADVLISYASEDRERAGKLASALSAHGWSVWWDRKIIAGQAFDSAIERELESAKSVVVLWSKHSIESEWVKNEASVAAERGILVPALIDEVKLPLEFRRKQTADLTGWQGDPLHGGLQSLFEGIAALMGNEAPHPPLNLKDLQSHRKSGWRQAVIGGLIMAFGVTIYTVWSWQDSSRNPIAGENRSGAPEEKPRPKALKFTVSTKDEADQVEISTAPIDGLAGRLKVCLQVKTQSGWWKGVGLNEHDPTLAGQKSDGLRCTIIAPGLINVAYWKAKGLGVHTPVGTSRLDLRQYKDHEVIFTWKTD